MAESGSSLGNTGAGGGGKGGNAGKGKPSPAKKRAETLPEIKARIARTGNPF